MNKTLPLPVAAILVCALAMLPVSAQNADPKMSFFIVSSGPGSGADLEGLAGADGRCQMLARAVGAGNRTWRAYLSATASDGQPAVNARDRIGSGPWFNAKGVQVASDVDDLHSDKQQPDQGDAAERVRKDGQRPGRQSQPARYPDRFAIGRHGPSRAATTPPAETGRVTAKAAPRSATTTAPVGARIPLRGIRRMALGAAARRTCRVPEAMGCTTASPSIEASDSSGQSIKSSSSPKPGRESARQSAPGSSLPDRRTFLRDTSRLGAAALAWASASALPVTALGGVPVGPGRLRKVRDFDIRKHPRYYYGPGPSPVIFPDGEILLAFRRHPAAARKHTHIETENFVVSSRDGGKTWGTPVSVDYGGVHNVNLTLLADGSVLYCTSVMETVTRAAYERVRALPQERVPGGAGRYRLSYSAEELGTYAVISGVSVRRSSDRGRTWSPRYWVSPIDGVPSLLPGAPSPANLRSPVIQFRNGRLLLPVYSYPNPWRVALMESADLGKSWSFRGRNRGTLGSVGSCRPAPWSTAPSPTTKPSSRRRPRASWWPSSEFTPASPSARARIGAAP